MGCRVPQELDPKEDLRRTSTVRFLTEDRPGGRVVSTAFIPHNDLPDAVDNLSAYPTLRRQGRVTS